MICHGDADRLLYCICEETYLDLTALLMNNNSQKPIEQPAFRYITKTDNKVHSKNVLVESIHSQHT